MAASIFSRPEDVRRADSSLRRLQSLGFAPNVAGLTKALAVKEIAVRAEAAFLWGYRGEPVSEALRRSLADNSARVRVETALALVRLGEVEAGMPVLRHELQGVFFQDAPLRAARALALTGDSTGYGRVLEALSSSLPSNRMEAVAVLPAFTPYAGQVVAGHVVDVVRDLIRAAEDSEAIIRSDALTALAESADPQAIPVLEAACQDSDPQVQTLAAFLLEQYFKDDGQA